MRLPPSPVAGLLSNIAATFKNFDLSVQSPMRVRSLLFESHRGITAALTFGDGEMIGTVDLVIAGPA